MSWFSVLFGNHPNSVCNTCGKSFRLCQCDRFDDWFPVGDRPRGEPVAWENEWGINELICESDVRRAGRKERSE